MIDRDILLILVGGFIGAVSSLATLVATYMMEGMRLRRKWQREDQLYMREKRGEIQSLLGRAGQPPPDDKIDRDE